MAVDEIAGDDDPAARLIAQMSWVVVYEAVRTMPVKFVTAIIGYGTVSFIGTKLLVAVDQLPQIDRHALVPKMLVGPAGLLALYFVESAILAAVAISIHRLILIDEKKNRIVTPFNSRTLVFTFWLVGLRLPYLLFFAIVLIAQVYSRLGSATVSLVVLCAFIPIFYAGVRTGLIFPAIAIDAPGNRVADQVAAAWRLSRDRFWRISWSAFLSILPLFILLVVIVLVAKAIFLVAALDLTGRAGTFVSMTRVAVYLDPISSSVLEVFTAALGAAALSWNYRIVTARPHS